MGMGLSSDELTTENFLPKPLSSKCVWVTPKIPPTEGKTPHFFQFLRRVPCYVDHFCDIKLSIYLNDTCLIF